MSGDYSPRGKTPEKRQVWTTPARLKDRVARASARQETARYRGACPHLPETGAFMEGGL